MIKFITSLLLGMSLMLPSLSFAVPAIPDDAVQDGRAMFECNGDIILKYGYTLANGHNVVLIKEPNKPALIYVEYDAAEEFIVAYVGPVKFDTMADLLAAYPDACAVFKKA